MTFILGGDFLVSILKYLNISGVTHVVRYLEWFTVLEEIGLKKTIYYISFLHPPQILDHFCFNRLLTLQFYECTAHSLVSEGYHHTTGKIYFPEKHSNEMKSWKYPYFSKTIWNIDVVSLLLRSNSPVSKVFPLLL